MPEICPRCGELGSRYTVTKGYRDYIYYLHYIGGGRENKKYRRCYIGPVEGYTLVAKLYNLDIRHAYNVEHKLHILETLISYFENYCGKEQNRKEQNQELSVEEMKRIETCRKFKQLLNNEKNKS